MQSGLGLPDESYYRKGAVRRRARRVHGARRACCTSAASCPEVTRRLRASVSSPHETLLAAEHWDVVRDREAEATYNPMTLADLGESAPGFDWQTWVDALSLR